MTRRPVHACPYCRCTPDPRRPDPGQTNTAAPFHQLVVEADRAMREPELRPILEGRTARRRATVKRATTKGTP